MSTFSLKREIYGMTPWCVGKNQLPMLLSVLDDLKSQDNQKKDIIPLHQRNNFVSLQTVSELKSEGLTSIVDNSKKLNDFKPNDQLIYVVNMDGVIIKNSSYSTNGADFMSSEIAKFDNDSRVIGGILVSSSPGGSSVAIEVMKDVLVDRKKPLVSWIPKTEYSLSASYFINCFTDEIYAERANCEVGSLGTMLEIRGYANESLDSSGRRVVRLYATKSVDKNKADEEALNNSNYELLLSEALDPLNEVLISDAKKYRQSLTDDNLTGKVYNSGNVIGSMVDGINDFDFVVERVKSLAKSKNNVKLSNNNNKSSKMNLQELQSTHPEIYNQAVSLGVNQEKDRVLSWVVHHETDSKAVIEGIKSGKEMTSQDTQSLLLKAVQKGNLQSLESKNTEEVKVPEGDLKNPVQEDGKDGKEVTSSADTFYGEVNKLLK